MACLVLGTESCSVYILDPEAFTIMDSLGLPSPPVFLSVSGLYDVEFRIVVACRSGELCVLKRGWQTAKVITALDSQPVGLVRREKNVTVATMDNCLISINNKVHRLNINIGTQCYVFMPGEEALERDVTPLCDLHREDGHPEPGHVPGGRGALLQSCPRLQRQERGGLLQD